MLTRPMTRGKTFHLSTCKMWLLDRWSLNCPFQNKCYTGLLPCVQILICKSVFHTVNRNAQSSAAVCFRISTYPSPHMFIIYKHTHTHTLLSLTASSRFQDEVEAPWLAHEVHHLLPFAHLSSLFSCRTPFSHAQQTQYSIKMGVLTQVSAFEHYSLPLEKSSTFFPPSNLFSRGPVRFWGKPSLNPPLLPPP